MWALKNDTPYAAERTWVRDKQGMHHWIVAVKATFTIHDDGALTLADEQTLSGCDQHVSLAYSFNGRYCDG